MAFASLKNTIYSWFTKEPLGVEHGGTGSNSVDVVSKIEELESAWDSVSQYAIVEAGMDDYDVWYYEKYANGTVKLWANGTLTNANNFCASFAPNLPFTMTAIIGAYATICSQMYNSLESLTANVKVAALSTTLFQVWGHSSSGEFGSQTAVPVSVHVIGRWK